MPTNRGTSKSNIFLTITLYILQGMNLGLTSSIPLFLIYYGATWKDRGTFNFAMYPFSLKLLWAPLIDVLYIKRFGRRKSWLVPILLISGAVLFSTSFFIQSWIVNNRVIILTIVFFIIVFLTASEDVCVDGLAITLFAVSNPQWASTSQAIGQTFGRFLGSSFLLTFESANFTNKFIREPLSLPYQTTGLFSLVHFIQFVAVAFLIVTVCLIIFVREKEETLDANGKKAHDLSLIETYLSIIKLFKKKCIQKIAIVSLISPIGFVAIQTMTPLALISQGVSRENLALVNIPVTLAALVTPLIIRHTERALDWYARFYVLYLIHALPLAVYVYFTPSMISSGYYYPILIILLTISEFIRTLLFASSVGFSASICQPDIGGTYMTLLATIANLGYALNSSAVLYAANLLPKKYDYITAVSVSSFLGLLWFSLSCRTLKRLQKLPASEWHIAKETNINGATTLDEQDQNKMNEHFLNVNKIIFSSLKLSCLSKKRKRFKQIIENYLHNINLEIDNNIPKFIRSLKTNQFLSLRSITISNLRYNEIKSCKNFSYLSQVLNRTEKIDQLMFQ
ncbi:unnamed protein product [Adineta steineri]|uniref:Acetyl-coenzyme A transporter 1 n=1 Tax=Adineta steineri TaxID=433720 RepID=A0A819JM64_9BILA|nr:unnamed protein product [Adineta steineri]